MVGSKSCIPVSHFHLVVSGHFLFCTWSVHANVASINVCLQQQHRNIKLSALFQVLQPFSRCRNTEDGVYLCVACRDHFRGMDIWNACYAHMWDPTKTKLFSSGGPLAFGLVGSYMGVWN